MLHERLEFGDLLQSLANGGEQPSILERNGRLVGESRKEIPLPF